MINDLIVSFAKSCTGQGILPSLYKGIQNSDTCEVKVDELNDILTLAGNVIEILLVLAGFIAVGFIIYGGFQYMLSSGEPGGIKKAKDTIVNAVIGLILAMLSFGIVRFITGRFS